MRRALTVLAALTLTACGGGAQSSNSGSTDSHTHPTEAATAASSPPAALPVAEAVATDSVVINDFLFAPAVIRVKSGTIVTWTNQDTEPHTVTVTGAGGFSSPVLKRGDRFSHSFAAAASVPYICSIHPYMKGGVIVTAA